MPRTTLDLDATVLQELKALQRRENKTLGRLASELLARALAATGGEPEPAAWAWTAAPMQARIDLEDREAVLRVLDDGDGARQQSDR